jgi:sugar phosphate isomerase/epimerase
VIDCPRQNAFVIRFSLFLYSYHNCYYVFLRFYYRRTRKTDHPRRDVKERTNIEITMNSIKKNGGEKICFFPHQKHGRQKLTLLWLNVERNGEYNRSLWELLGSYAVHVVREFKRADWSHRNCGYDLIDLLRDCSPCYVVDSSNIYWSFYQWQSITFISPLKNHRIFFHVGFLKTAN